MAERIAILTAEVNEAYQAELWRGIVDETTRLGLQAVCFLGSRIDSPIQQEAASNTVYHMAHAGNFDGLIIISSAVSTYLDPSQVQFLFDDHPHIPKISVGIPVQGAGSISVDGTRAMKQLTRHMVEEHGSKDFALIAGPPWHPESEQRREAVIEVLKEYDLAIPDSMLIHGTYQLSSGKDAMSRILREHRRIDTVLCLNDRMAIGAMEALSEAGISVPEEVAVCGFDGIEESSYCSPPLTTVEQPLYELGVHAVVELKRVLSGSPARSISMDCRPLFRQSCSCGSITNPVTESGGLPEESGQSNGTPEGEVPEFSEDNPEDPGSFLQTFDLTVNSSSFSPGDIPGLEQRLNILDARFNSPESGILQPRTGSPGWQEALKSAREILWHAKTRVLLSTRLEKQTRIDILRNVVTSLSSAFELPELFSRLTEGMRQLGIADAFLIMYDKSAVPHQMNGKLVYCLKDGEHSGDPDEPVRNGDLLPGGTARLDHSTQDIWVLTPLVFQDRAIGHLILPGTNRHTEIYEALSRQLASSIQGALLLNQVKTHEQSLELEVRRRTLQLTDVNRDLRREVSKRIRLENEVVDISKQTMERIGQDLHDDLCQHLAGITMHVSALGRNIAQDSPDSLPVVHRINSLLSESIDRAKGIVRGLLPPGLKEDGVLRALELLCMEMEKTSGIEIRWESDADLSAMSVERAIELYRILQEALNNAVKHSGAAAIQLNVTVQSGKDSFKAIVEDNGRGMALTGTTKGMGLKIMNYRGEKAEIAVRFEDTQPGTRVICTGRI